VNDLASTAAIRERLHTLLADQAVTTWGRPLRGVFIDSSGVGVLIGARRAAPMPRSGFGLSRDGHVASVLDVLA